MRVFVTGAAGYVGGTVAHVLVRAGHEVRGLVRSAEQAAALAATGVVPVTGDLADVDLLVREARQADAVANCADSDGRPAIEALLGAMAGSGKTLVHTSGVTVVADCAGGTVRSAVHDETSDFRLWSPRKDRVDIDNLVVCSATTQVATAVLCLPLLYGVGLGLTPRGGIDKTMRNNVIQGEVGYVGDGTNRWSTAHIADVAQLFLHVIQGRPTGEFFFVEAGEVALGDLAKAIAATTPGATAVSFDIEAATERWGRGRAQVAFGSNCRVRATRVRSRFNWTASEPDILTFMDRKGCA